MVRYKTGYVKSIKWCS